HPAFPVRGPSPPTPEGPFVPSLDPQHSVWLRWPPIFRTPLPPPTLARPLASSEGAAIPQAPTAPRAAARSPRTVAASSVLPPAAASNTAHASPAGHPFSSAVAADSSATRCQPASARRAAATGSPDCRR